MCTDTFSPTPCLCHFSRLSWRYASATPPDIKNVFLPNGFPLDSRRVESVSAVNKQLNQPLEWQNAEVLIGATWSWKIAFIVGWDGNCSQALFCHWLGRCNERVCRSGKARVAIDDHPRKFPSLASFYLISRIIVDASALFYCRTVKLSADINNGLGNKSVRILMTK